jgi:hypothetical protein
MSDEQTLLVVIAVIYLADCVFWIPRQGFGFTRWISGKWNVRRPSVLIGNHRGGIGFVNPFPPLGLATRAAGRTCDGKAIKKRVEEFERESRRLKLLCNVLFFFLFGACPYMVWRLGMVGAIWPVVLGLYLQTILIATLFWRAHRRLYPKRRDETFKPFFTMLLAAPSAIRAQDVLGRCLLEEFHPLTAVKALCSEADLARVAEPILRDLRYPAGTISETERTARLSLLKELGMENLLRAPKPSEAEHVKYCPRCLQQFTVAGTTCADCGGRELLKF